jgi:hypothetical protein
VRELASPRGRPVGADLADFITAGSFGYEQNVAAADRRSRVCRGRRRSARKSGSAEHDQYRRTSEGLREPLHVNLPSRKGEILNPLEERKKGMGKLRLLVLMAIVALAAVVGAVTARPAAAAPQTVDFTLIFHASVSNSCPTGVLTCGTVVVPGFGQAMATFTPTGFVPGVPEPNCFIGEGIVGITLESDGSTLQLATEAAACTPGASGSAPGGAPFQAEGTWSVIEGTGVFSGATGGGTTSTNNAGDVTVSRYFGTITLP